MAQARARDPLEMFLTGELSAPAGAAMPAAPAAAGDALDEFLVGPGSGVRIAPGAIARPSGQSLRSAPPPQWGLTDQIFSGLAGGWGPTLAGTENYLTGRAGALSLPNAIANAESEQESYERTHGYAKPVELAATIPTAIAANALTPGLGALMRSPSLAIRGAGYGIAGMEDALVQQGTTEGDVASNALTGYAINTALPYGGAMLRPLVRGASKVDPGVVDLMTRLEGEGVKLRPSQVSMSGALRKADELLASGGNDQQLRDFTRAVSRSFGENTDRITPSVLSGALKRIEGNIDNIVSQANVTLTPQLAHGMSLVGRTRKGLVKANQDQINEALAEINGAFVNGKMDGETYKTLVTEKGSVIRNLQTADNATVRDAGNKLRELLDDALEASSPPGLRDDWANARSELKNLFAVQPIMEGVVTGIVPPQKLHAQVRKFYNEYGWGPLPGSMDTLAEGGRLLPDVDQYGHVKEAAKLPWWTKAGITLPGAVGGGLLEYYVFSQSPKIAAAAATGATISGLGQTAVRGFMGSEFYRNALTGGVAVPGRVTAIASPAMIGAVNLLKQPDADDEPAGAPALRGAVVPPAMR